jgi:hypothetical protein
MIRETKEALAAKSEGRVEIKPDTTLEATTDAASTGTDLAATPEPSTEEAAAWNALGADASSVEIKDFIAAYPDGPFTADAKERLIDALNAELDKRNAETAAEAAKTADALKALEDAKAAEIAAAVEAARAAEAAKAADALKALEDTKAAEIAKAVEMAKAAEAAKAAAALKAAEDTMAAEIAEAIEAARAADAAQVEADLAAAEANAADTTDETTEELQVEVAQSADVLLQSLDGSVSVNGTIVDFNDALITIETSYGVIGIENVEIECIGASCPPELLLTQ